MWSDVQQALSENEGGTPPPLVESPVTDPAQRARVAVVASVATPQPSAKPEDPAQKAYGETSGGRLRTRTGGIV
jgi:hypothetical protein